MDYKKRPQTHNKFSKDRKFDRKAPNLRHQTPRTRVMENSTSWGKVADWYDSHLAEKDTYHEMVVLPNLLRLVSPKPGMNLVDMATGQGYFARAFAKAGAKVVAFDISKDLIETAKNNPESIALKDKIDFHVTPAERAEGIASNSADVLTLVLALQNIQDILSTAKQISRILKKDGRAYIVLNHPAFRIPKKSSWQFDNINEEQYRRIDGYMQERSVRIDMHPGKTASGFSPSETISFHRPLQSYVKAFSANGLAITNLEEWISHRQSEPGPRKDAEDRARKEFPLFMCIEVKKI